MSLTNTFTAEQIKRMEENRLKALQKKQEKTVTSYSNSKPSYSNVPNSNVLGPSNSNLLVGKCVPFADDPENRFEIRVGYNKTLIEIFKTVNSRKYDPITKYWNFSMKNYTDLISRITMQLKNEVKLEPMEKTGKPKFVAKCVLIDRKTFEVQASFNVELQDLFKKMSTKRYDPQLKCWSFELREYERLIKEVNEKLGGSVSIVPLPKAVREVFKAHIEGNYREKFEIPVDDNVLKSKIDKNIVKNLLPFQYDGVKFAVNLNGRVLLADDMGLGKTVQALAIANYYKDEWPLLIMTPSSVKYMWKESVLKWLPNVLNDLSMGNDVDELIQVLESTKQTMHTNSKIVVCSYDLMLRMIDYLVQCNFKVIIADECHFLKNGKAERTKAALKIFEKSTRAIFLSGTPALSRPAELYSQIHAINPSLFSNFSDFGSRYCDGKETNYGMDYSGSSNMKELQLILEEKVMIRREKKDVITQLPTKVREMIILDPSLIEIDKKSLKQASSQMQNEKLKGMEKRGALLTFFSETSKVKAKAVCEYVREFLDSGRKFIVFAHHQSMLDAIQAECEQGKYDYMRIDGSTNSEKRTANVDKFQAHEKCRIAILSITAANSGITLTEANLVLFAELFWNPGILVQAEDRVYRIGQRNSVMIQYLCAKSTADDFIWPLVNDKLSVLSKAGLTRENLSNANMVPNFSNSTNKIDDYLISDNEMTDIMASDNLEELIKNDELFSQIQASLQNNSITAKSSKTDMQTKNSKPTVSIKQTRSDDVYIVEDDDDFFS